jgi:hypothetical protein
MRMLLSVVPRTRRMVVRNILKRCNVMVMVMVMVMVQKPPILLYQMQAKVEDVVRGA